MARLKTMRAIDYNYWQTLIKLLKDNIPNLIDYGSINCKRIAVRPAYPRDITNMSKPSIIVRKVEGYQKKLAMNNLIGQHHDTDDNAIYDVFGIEYRELFQFDVMGDSNTQSLLIVSAISEMFSNILTNDKGEFPLYDFTEDIKNPKEYGRCVIMSLPRTINLTSWKIGVAEPTNNNDYLNIIREESSIVQRIVPHQDLVDLSKWIKIKQHIKLKRSDING